MELVSVIIIKNALIIEGRIVAIINRINSVTVNSATVRENSVNRPLTDSMLKCSIAY